MRMRRSIVLGLAMALATSGFAAYEARLYFRNATTGYDGPGAVLASPGDLIEIWYFFNALDEVPPYQWGTIQMTLILDNQIMTDADANTWKIEVGSKFFPRYPIKVGHQPDDGPIYDDAVDPKNSTKPFVTDRGVYYLAGVYAQHTHARYFNKMLFDFVVGPALPNEVLDWAFAGRGTGTGLSTRILDGVGASVTITDNYVKIVPEPGSIAATAAGLMGLLAMRQRKE